MPDPRHFPMPRRRLLSGASLLALGAATIGACTTSTPPPQEPPPRDPLEDLLDAHVSLRSAYDEALSSVTDQPRLTTLRANVDEHIVALAAAIPVHPPSAEPTSAASSSEAVTAPTDPATVVADLAQREALLAADSRALAINQPADRAPLLASVAAAHTAAVAMLA